MQDSALITSDDNAMGISLMAHRGWASKYPENTLAALSAAGESGINFIEFDIQLTRDGVPVLLHDEDLMRTGATSQVVTSSDYVDLVGLEVNYPEKFSGHHHGHLLPTLAAALILLDEHPEWIYFIELKRESIDAFGTKACVNQLLPLIYDYLPQCVVISFEYDCLQEVCRRSDVAIGWVLRQYNEDAYKKAIELDPDYLIINHSRLPSGSNAVWQGGWHWASYEVTEPTTAKMLHLRGIDIISSMDAPGLAKALLESGI
jgi:glycerophosphoryl diester phosphodiesterase